MKLIAHNQLIGLGNGVAVFRDLFEDDNGDRVSVPTSREFWMEAERTLPDGRLTRYPSNEVIFEKHRLSHN